MKNLKRIIALLCVFTLLGALAVDVFAAGTAKGKLNTVTFTVTTGKKDSKLTITPSSGKITATAWKNPIKGTTKTITKSGVYGSYTVTVYGVGSKTMTNKKVTFNLAKNTTYTVCVSYNDNMFNAPDVCWNKKWVKPCSWKASANNSAKIK